MPGPALEPQRCLCADCCSSHTCAEAAGGTGALSLYCPLLASSPLQKHRDPQGSVEPPLPIDEGTPWHFRGQPRLWMREAQAQLEHPFPPCPRAPAAVAVPPSLGRDAQHPPDLICQHSTLLPACQCWVPLQPLSPSLCHPMPRIPLCRGAAARRVPRLCFLSPGKGRELPSSLPRVPQTSQETVTSSGCTEPAPDSWHRRDSWEPSPASSLLSPAHVPPSPEPLLCCSGHRAATLAQLHRPQPCPALRVAGSPASEDVGREERGQVSDTAGDRGEGQRVPCCQARSLFTERGASSRVSETAMPEGCPGSWQCPSPGDASGLSCLE